MIAVAKGGMASVIQSAAAPTKIIRQMREAGVGCSIGSKPAPAARPSANNALSTGTTLILRTRLPSGSMWIG
ncbi:MAG: hypothetical protein BWZ10_02695 [candidate division BRC1 bacterium ADurb.BinA364]|nr:MAG: hypothetical protein BWZ10_02695 [candidate division BRC1 bacterium ADurb.BinA364]